MKTIYQANFDLSHAFGKAVTEYPDVLYFGLSTTSALTENAFTEATGGGYARIPLMNSAENFTTADNKMIKLNATITFPESTENWGTIYAVGIFDAVTDGHLLYFQNLTTSKTIESDTTLRFTEQSITFTES